MFNYLAVAPDNKNLMSRSDVSAPFKVVALKDGEWDSYASAATFVGAVEALNILSNRFSSKTYTKWEIVKATAVSYETWAALQSVKEAK